MVWKRTALLLVTVFVLGCSAFAGAAGSPSVDNGALTTASAGEVVLSEKTNEIISAIQQLVSGGGTPAEFFGTSVAGQIASLLPAGISVDDLELDEVVAVNLSGYSPSALAEMGLELGLPTYYADGATVIVLVGITAADGSMEWIPVQGEASSGKVHLAFDDETAEKMDGIIVFAVLSAK